MLMKVARCVELESKPNLLGTETGTEKGTV